MIEQLVVELLTPSMNTSPELAAPAEEISAAAENNAPEQGAGVVDFEKGVVYLDFSDANRDHFPYN